MVLSCLVEPLVSPLIGRDTSGRRRGTALAGTRLAGTALVMSALVAATTPGLAYEIAAHGAKVEAKAQKAPAMRNAHARPAPIRYHEMFAAVLFAHREDELSEPGEAPAFEHGLMDVHRLKHKRNLARDGGPGLGLALRIDRLYGGTAVTFLRFGSAVHLSGRPERRESIAARHIA